MKKFEYILVTALILATASLGALAQTLEVTPTSLEQVGNQFAGAAAQSFSVRDGDDNTNTQSGYVITDDAAWLSVSPASGISTGQYSAFVVTYDISAFGFNTASSAVISIVQTNAGAIQTQTVSVLVSKENAAAEGDGTVLGNSWARYPSSIAIGSHTQLAIAGAANAVQIGPGTNNNANTVKFGAVELMSNGTIRTGVLPSLSGSYQPFGSLTFTSKFVDALAYSPGAGGTGALVITYRAIAVISNRLDSIGASTVVTNSM